MSRMRKLSLGAAVLLVACGSVAVDAAPDTLPVSGDAGAVPALDASAPSDASAPDVAPACDDDRSPVSDACQVVQVTPDGGPCGTTALYVCEAWDGGTRPDLDGCRPDGPVLGGGLAWRCPLGCVRNARHEPAVCGDGGAYYSCAAGHVTGSVTGCTEVAPAASGSLVSVWCCR